MSLIEEELTRSTIGAFYDSYNKLGYGFLENVCVGALMKELIRRGHRVEREVPIPVCHGLEPRFKRMIYTHDIKKQFLNPWPVQSDLRESAQDSPP